MTRYRVTRTVDVDDPNNFAHREVAEGEILYRYLLPTYRVITPNGFAACWQPDEEPFFEFPQDAVEPAEEDR